MIKKKKLLAWLLTGAMMLSSGQMAFAEELSDGSSAEAVYDSMEVTGESDLLIPETSEQPEVFIPEIQEEIPSVGVEEANTMATENVEEDPSEEGETGDELLDFTEEELLTSEMESEELIEEEDMVSVGASLNSSVQGKPDGTSIRQSDFTEPKEGNIIVGLKGKFVRSEAGIREAIALINSYRLQACQKGEPDPRNPSRKLTIDDYVPISWSAALEWMAQTRAAEAAYLGGGWNHTRLDGSSCFSVKHNGIISFGESLAYGTGGEGYTSGIKMWYAERNAWMNQTSGVATGHYTMMINPEYISVGLGAFAGYSYAVCGEFSRKVDSDTTPAASGPYIQLAQIPKDTVRPSLFNIQINEFFDMYDDRFLMSGGQVRPYLKSTKNPYRILIPIGEEITWSIDDPSKVTFDSEGYVTALSGGSVTVNLSWKDITASQEVPVVENPILISAESTSNGVCLKFNKSNSFSKYFLYRSEKGESGEICIATILPDSKYVTSAGDAFLYVDGQVKAGRTYSYTVMGMKGWEEVPSNGLTIRYIGNLVVESQNTEKGIQLDWNFSQLPQTQKIYRKTKDSEYQLLATLGTNNWTFTDSTAKTGVTYTYKLTQEGYDDYYAEGETEILCLSSPVFKPSSNTMDGIKLNWNPVAGCNGYNIYRVNSNGSLKRLGNVPKGTTSYIDTDVVSGKSYTYAVKAYKGKTISSYNTLRKTFLSGVTAKAYNNKTGMTITWNKVASAAGYRVYRKPASSSEAYTLIATVPSTKNSYLDKETLVGGRAYVYYVRAYRGNVLSTGKTYTMRSLKVPNLTLTSSSGNVQLKWTKTSGAKGYYIYRKTGNGSYEKIGSVTGVGTLRYTDTSAVKGKTYSYAVRAYNGGALSAYIEKNITVK